MASGFGNGEFNFVWQWRVALKKPLRLCCTRTTKPGADRGFFVERAALCILTSRLFGVERPALTKAGGINKGERL
jgi:hypothetical protein